MLTLGRDPGQFIVLIDKKTGSEIARFCVKPNKRVQRGGDKYHISVDAGSNISILRSELLSRNPCK